MKLFRQMLLTGLTILSFGICRADSPLQEHPVEPYVDPSQLNVPWGSIDFYKQPWRAYMETKSGYDFLQGIGINYNLPGNDDLAVAALANAGFKSMRFEIGWGSVNWEETGLVNQNRITHLFHLFKQYGIRPNILLNGHQGRPCPMINLNKTIELDAAKGARMLQLTDPSGVVPWHTGLGYLTGYTAAEVIITSIDSSGYCTLSKPLPVALTSGTHVQLNNLKYMPFSALGSNEYEDTANGWVKYAMLIAKQLSDAGITEFDLEMWNELNFGSAFLNVNNYYSPPAVVYPSTDFFKQGGHLWDVANRTVQAVKWHYSGARVIWGFSNTSYFRTPQLSLPPGIDGQSYHPYGTGLRSFPSLYQGRSVGTAFVPAVHMRRPEGWASDFQQTESLMRLLNPVTRSAKPQWSTSFHHYITEHGVLPADCGVTDEATAWELKSKVAIRSLCFWLNKGIEHVDLFSAFDKNPLGYGLMPANTDTLPSSTSPQNIYSQPLRSIQTMTSWFSESVPIANPQQLSIKVVGLGDQFNIFEGDATHPALGARDVFTALPFQINQSKFLMALYTMTYDILAPTPDMKYRLTIGNLNGPPINIQYGDPVKQIWRNVNVVGYSKNSVTVELSVTDCPNFLVISTSPQS